MHRRKNPKPEKSKKNQKRQVPIYSRNLEARQPIAYSNTPDNDYNGRSYAAEAKHKMEIYNEILKKGVKETPLEALLNFSADLDYLRSDLIDSIAARMEVLEKSVPYNELQKIHKNSLLAKGVPSQLGRYA